MTTPCTGPSHGATTSVSGSLSLDDRLGLLMQGVDLGDSRTRDTMAAELRDRLVESDCTGRPLRVYLGVDPTSSDLHLGHTVPLRKLRQFQDLGHEVVFVVGSFTALIGDPSEKNKARPQQTAEQVRAHAQTYVDQVHRVLDPERTVIDYNDRWLAPLTFAELIELASHFTVQQFLTRDNFAKRFGNKDPIWLHEFFYALMQAYDAVALETDVQVGGTEQLFNLMAGRKLMVAAGQRPQVCLTLPILVGTDGHKRMSKSTGNTIGIADPPNDKFGKVMSLPDEAMLNYAELVTRWTPTEVRVFGKALADGSLHPRDAKMRLAAEIVSVFHGDEVAQHARRVFQRVFQQRRLPEDISSYEMAGPMTLVDLLVASGMASSKSAARRLIQQRGVRLDGDFVEDAFAMVEPAGQLLRVGKHRFLRLARV